MIYFNTTTSRSILLALFFFALTLAPTSPVSAQWVKTNGPTGLVPTQALEIIDSHLLSSSSDGISMTQDSGQTWNWTGGSVNVSAFAQVNQKIFAVGNALVVSSDSGRSWEPIINGNIEWGYSIAGNDSAVLVGTPFNEIFRSSDGGQSWLPADSGLPPNSSIPILTATGTNFIAATNSAIFLSTDNGQSWNIVKNIGAPNAIVSANSEIVLAADSSLYFSNDNGAIWHSIPNGFGYGEISSLTLWQNKIIAGTYDSGVFLSSLSNLHWSSANSGLDDQRITCLAVTPSDIFAGTVGGYVWRRPISDFALSSVSSTPGPNTSLSAYPNPFTYITTVKVTIEESGYVTVSIVNQLGVEIARVFTGELAPGEHSFQWNVPAGLARGMYECVTRINDSTSYIPILVQ